MVSKLTEEQIKNYQVLANIIRAQSCRMTTRSKSYHLGGCLSMTDILVVLYTSILKIDPKNPTWEGRDRFILSKGHAAPALYAILAELGFFPMSWLDDYYMDGGHLSGHASTSVPGVELSTGSLGHGLPVGVGMALNSKVRGLDYRVFVMSSDGDCNEGSTWEAVMFAAQHNLDNLIVIVDYNKIQALGRSFNIINLEPLAKKVESFNWAVKEINGHDFNEINDSLLNLPFKKGKPSWIIANTIKGKGVSSLEDKVESHYVHFNEEELKIAYNELGVSF
jgi:transketolase